MNKGLIDVGGTIIYTVKMLPRDNATKQFIHQLNQYYIIPTEKISLRPRVDDN